MSGSSFLSAVRFVAVAAIGVGILSHSAMEAQAKGQTQEKKSPTAVQPKDAEAGKAKQRITQLKKLKLIEMLDMDEQTAEKFFVRYNAEQKKVDEAINALNETMKELSKASNQDPKKSSPELLKQLINQTLDKQTQMQAAVAERLRSLRSVLDDQQYAKYLLFEAKFQEEVRKTLLDVKRDNKKEDEQSSQKK